MCKYGEGGRVEVEKYACVFRGREGQNSDFFCVRNMRMHPYKIFLDAQQVTIRLFKNTMVTLTILVVH